ncbi:hypothetical protein MVEN_02532400 [Mycena venus]|uniref:Uncharacterized protein n=1 Tax=Mycena venus TaxID=2733690 RepID=A0A8H7CAY2_9AGAR|nr:hypothetical protein MVEN_02532400 [Mycena venus]
MSGANVLSGFSLTTTFPDHDACFGDASNSSSVCHIPSPTMIKFLNISDPGSYLGSYCNNPPVDSCAFGYCPNPDVASPAVRFSVYFTSLVSAILVLYSPEDVESSFFAQLLNVYSLIVAAMVAIAEHNLTKLHSVIALMLAASPLSLYLLAYVLRSLTGRHTRLDKVFGKGKYVNRGVVLLAFPLWIGVLTFTAMPTSIWQFQQAACDSIVAENRIVRLFFLPFIIFFDVFPEIGGILLGIFFLTWGTAVYRLRAIIWAKHNRRFPFGRLWRKVVEHYPFIQFCTVIFVPHFIWIFNIEIGLQILSTRESFSATYGQLLAIFVTVPPFIQLCILLPRVPKWFMDLTWVRFVTCRRNKPRFSDRSREESDSGIPLNTSSMMDPQKYDPDSLSSNNTSGVLNQY